MVADVQTEAGARGQLHVTFTNGGLQGFLELFIPFMAAWLRT